MSMQRPGPLPAEQPSNPVPRMGGNTIKTWQQRVTEADALSDDETPGLSSFNACLAEIADLRSELARIVGQQTKESGK